MKNLLLCLLLFVATTLVAQPKTLLLDEYFNLIKRYHPVAKQGTITVEMAKANITTAKGGFDPGWKTDVSRKELDGLLYYNGNVNQLTIPTWFGVEFQAGWEYLTGERTPTPETKGASSFVGFSVPIARNLLLDKRRAALKNARIYQQASEQERQAMLNNLLQEAAVAYWNWWEATALTQLFADATAIAQARLRLVKTAYQLGDRPAIDTLEAFTQWQAFLIRLNERQLEQTNARQEISVFLWDANANPYELNAAIQPQVSQQLQPPQLEALLQQLPQHPDLQQYHYKLSALDVNRKLAFQSFLPAVNLKYNQLARTHDIGKNFSTPWLENNYRFGISASIPLRLSEARGEYRKAKLQIQQTILDKDYKEVQLETKVKQYYQQWTQLQQQVALQQESVRLYTVLQKAEEQKFMNGESSLFVINTRELNTLQAQEKLITLQAKYNKAFYNTLWSAGLLQ